MLIGANFHHDGILQPDMGDEATGGVMLERHATRSPNGPEHFPVVMEKAMRHPLVCKP